MTSAPDPSTAIVDPPPASAPRCAAESTPRARPLTTTTPRAARSAARRSATASAYGDAAREPTMATAGRSSAAATPRIQSTSGGSAMAASAAGYDGSLQGTALMPPLASRDALAASARRVERGAFRSARTRGGQAARSKTVAGASPARRRSAASRQRHGGSSDRRDEIGQVGHGRTSTRRRDLKTRGRTAARTCGARPPALDYSARVARTRSTTFRNGGPTNRAKRGAIRHALPWHMACSNSAEEPT